MSHDLTAAEKEGGWVGVPKQVQNYLPATARNRNGIRQVYLSKKVLYLVDNSVAAFEVGEKLEVFFFSLSFPCSV